MMIMMMTMIVMMSMMKSDLICSRNLGETMSVNLVHATSSMKTHVGGAHWQLSNRSA